MNPLKKLLVKRRIEKLIVRNYKEQVDRKKQYDMDMYELRRVQKKLEEKYAELDNETVIG